jgi:hypothetical protein
VSYDLYLKPRQGEIEAQKVYDYFAARPHFEVNPPQAIYRNEDTGVYFVVELQGAEAGDEAEDGYPLAVNVNYFRPSFFGLEVEPEIGRFVAAFDLVAMDPQHGGMGEGEYVPELFLAGWNAGNEFGYSAILKDNPEARGMALAKAELLRSWRWNLEREALQAVLGEDIFVPRIMYLMVDGVPATAMVWPDGIPVAVVPVDFIVVPRRELAPRRFFLRKEDNVVITWQQAQPVLQKHGKARADGTLVLDYGNPPEDVQEFVRSLREVRRDISGISADRLLDRELVERPGA